MKKQQTAEYIEKHRDEIFSQADRLWHSPELGFHEFKTREIIREWIRKKNYTVDKEYAYTGLSVSLGSGKPHIGIVAEMDAIPTRGHPDCDPETTAAHACGHSSQMAIAMAAFDALHQLSDLKGKVTLYFTPAEEFTDIEYRQKLQQEGKIRFLSGKQNMLAENVLEDVDCLIHMHATGTPYRYSVDYQLAGFQYKKFTFIGKSAHAGVLPHEGINAVNELSLFLTASAMLRETFRDGEMMRFHGMITEGGNTVNSIPDRAEYISYVRSIHTDTLLKFSRQLTETARHCAAAIGGECLVEDIPGYLPLRQSHKLNEVLMDNIADYCDRTEITVGVDNIAAGDVGDLSVFYPIIQYEFSGYVGPLHGPKARVTDPEEVYITQPKIIAGTVIDLLEKPELVAQIRTEFQPAMSREDYLKHLTGE